MVWNPVKFSKSNLAALIGLCVFWLTISILEKNTQKTPWFLSKSWWKPFSTNWRLIGHYILILGASQIFYWSQQKIQVFQILNKSLSKYIKAAGFLHIYMFKQDLHKHTTQYDSTFWLILCRWARYRQGKLSLKCSTKKQKAISS